MANNEGGPSRKKLETGCMKAEKDRQQRWVPASSWPGLSTTQRAMGRAPRGQERAGQGSWIHGFMDSRTAHIHQPPLQLFCCSRDGSSCATHLGPLAARPATRVCQMRPMEAAVAADGRASAANRISTAPRPGCINRPKRLSRWRCGVMRGQCGTTYQQTRDDRGCSRRKRDCCIDAVERH